MSEARCYLLGVDGLADWLGDPGVDSVDFGSAWLILESDCPTFCSCVAGVAGLAVASSARTAMGLSNRADIAKDIFNNVINTVLLTRCHKGSTIVCSPDFRFPFTLESKNICTKMVGYYYAIACGGR
jgi:hypothetical protein